MRKRRQGRNPLFAKRWFPDQVIVTCVRWYLRFRLSYRDLAAIAAELGAPVAPSTILRWVVRYTEEFVRRWQPFEQMVGRSWRADETYIKVNGGWVYLYRAVDERGRTVPLRVLEVGSGTVKVHADHPDEPVQGPPLPRSGHPSGCALVPEISPLLRACLRDSGGARPIRGC